MSNKHNHGQPHNRSNNHPINLENDYPKTIPVNSNQSIDPNQATQSSPLYATKPQSSYRILFWVIPLLVVLALGAYWLSMSQVLNNQPNNNSSNSKASMNSVVSISSSSSPSSVASSVTSSVTSTITTKNISIISSTGLLIPNLKATIDGKDFLAKDNQITIQIDSNKSNLPVTITGDGYTTVKADKLDQVASLVNMPVSIPKPAEPVVATPAPVPVPITPTNQVLASRVAFTSQKDGVSRLYSAKSDGSDIKLLSGDMTVNSQLETKGSEVWFQATVNDTENALYKADINNGNLNKIAQFRPYESKDGNNQQIAYDVISGKRIRIVENDYNNTSGTFISRLWVANIDGSNEKLVRERVYNDGQERVSGWKISPDGNKISYILYKYNKENNFVQSRLLVVDINNPSQFRTQWIDNNKNFSVTEMGFSGDSKYHLYTVYNSGDQKSSTFIFDHSNTGFKEIKNLSGGYGQFTMDGKTYIFVDVRDDKANLYKINIVDATVSQLTNSGTVGAYYVNGNDIYIKQDKKTYYLDDKNQLIESKIETNNLGWLGGNQFYGGM